MTAFWLSLVMAAAGCAGLILAGRGMWQGWAIGLAVQPVWIAFGIVTQGYGLILTALMYGGVYARNLWKWQRTDALHPEDELAVAQATTDFYRKMAGRFARELEHYKSLSTVRGAEQDERSWQQSVDRLAS